MSNSKAPKVTLKKVLVGASDMYYTALDGRIKVIPVYRANGSVRYWRVEDNGEVRMSSDTLRAVRTRIANNFMFDPGIGELEKMQQRVEQFLQNQSSV